MIGDLPLDVLALVLWHLVKIETRGIRGQESTTTGTVVGRVGRVGVLNRVLYERVLGSDDHVWMLLARLLYPRGVVSVEEEENDKEEEGVSYRSFKELVRDDNRRGCPVVRWDSSMRESTAAALDDTTGHEFLFTMSRCGSVLWIVTMMEVGRAWRYGGCQCLNVAIRMEYRHGVSLMNTEIPGDVYVALVREDNDSGHSMTYGGVVGDLYRKGWYPPWVGDERVDTSSLSVKDKRDIWLCDVRARDALDRSLFGLHRVICLFQCCSVDDVQRGNSWCTCTLRFGNIMSELYETYSTAIGSHYCGIYVMFGSQDCMYPCRLGQLEQLLTQEGCNRLCGRDGRVMREWEPVDL
jgi:hypothetical protein